MNRWQLAVEEFHHATNSTIGTDIEIRDRALRAKLIMEEAVETVSALGFEVSASIHETRDENEVMIGRFYKDYDEPHLLDFIDGLCDLVYVTLGAAVAAGVDLDGHFEEVHRANMTKLTGPKRKDGKIMKPEGWKPPDHEKIVRQADRFNADWKRLEEAIDGR